MFQTIQRKNLKHGDRIQVREHIGEATSTGEMPLFLKCETCEFEHQISHTVRTVTVIK